MNYELPQSGVWEINNILELDYPCTAIFHGGRVSIQFESALDYIVYLYGVDKNKANKYISEAIERKCK